MSPKNAAAVAVPAKKRMTLRVTANTLMNANGHWERVNQFELIGKEFTHGQALRRALGNRKPAAMTMTDENTVEVAGPVAGAMQTKTVFSVIRYSSQCPECGAMPTHRNEWCELCVSQMAVTAETFNSEDALKELLGLETLPDDDDDDDDAS